jgi:hypothetical protein
LRVFWTLSLHRNIDFAAGEADSLIAASFVQPAGVE